MYIEQVTSFYLRYILDQSARVILDIFAASCLPRPVALLGNSVVKQVRGACYAEGARCSAGDKSPEKSVYINMFSSSHITNIRRFVTKSLESTIMSIRHYF